MGGWPSTTGNPSGGGRWNNEEDDGYDDYNDGVYEPVRTVSTYSGPSQFQLRQNQLHNDRLDAQDRDAIRAAYNSNEERQELYREISQLEKKKSEIRYVGKSDYIAREYFGEESYEALLDTIIRPLAETCHKITEMKSSRATSDDGPLVYRNMLDIMQYPKLSKDDHILITEGYMFWHGGKYLFKSDWNDDSEDLTLVDPGQYRHQTSLKIITAEEIQLLNDKKQEFLGLLTKKDEEFVRYMEYVALFDCGGWLLNVRFRHDPELRQFVSGEWLPDSYKHPYYGPQKHAAHEPTSGPLVDIKDAMAKDVLELESEIEKLEARLAEIKAAYEKDVAKYSGNSW